MVIYFLSLSLFTVVISITYILGEHSKTHKVLWNIVSIGLFLICIFVVNFYKSYYSIDEKIYNGSIIIAFALFVITQLLYYRIIK